MKLYIYDMVLTERGVDIPEFCPSCQASLTEQRDLLMVDDYGQILEGVGHILCRYCSTELASSNETRLSGLG